MAKVLLLEDDVELAASVKEWLVSEKYTVEVAHDCTEADNLLALGDYDLLILDRGLPREDGLEVCKRYRSRGGMKPVLMLTGMNTTADKEVGLDSGADDYLTKPFEMRELSARLRALLRRPAAIQADTLTGRGIELNKMTWQVKRNGKDIKLFPKELLILEFLMRHPNCIFDIDTLQRRIWPSESESSPETLRVHITRLRTKLQSEDERPVIKTVVGQGYMFDNSE